MTTIRNQRLKGRLELTWTNKDQRLLSHGEDTYEWTSPDDHRVSEVRLLRSGDAVGDTNPDEGRAKDNLLIQGDALHALTALTEIPEFASEYRGKVNLVYVDPPFNTGQMFEHYKDSVEHSVWLTQMRDRLQQVRDLLHTNGSVWVHLDDEEVHYCRVILDEVFGRANFAGSVIWRSTDNSNNDAKTFSVDHNVILVYGKTEGWRTNAQPRTEQQASHYANPDDDPRGPWFDGNPLGSPSPRDNLRFDLVSPQGHVIKPPPNGWRWSRDTLQAKIDSGEIRFTADGTGIRRRTYLNEQKGLPPSSVWTDITETGSNRRAKHELKRLFPGTPTASLFATPKPEALLRKILQTATQPGDVVLDFFAGSGTTAAVAHKMRRRWVTVELSQSNHDTFTRPRLEAVVAGTDPGGITADAAWTGGGGFRCLTVSPPMFEKDDDGTLLLAEWVTNGKFAEAVAAQLGYEGLGPEHRPFSGQKGRMRLAVVDGVAGPAEVDFLVSALDQGERLMLVAKAATEGTEAHLRAASPGSRLRQAPRDLLRARAHGRKSR